MTNKKRLYFKSVDLLPLPTLWDYNKAVQLTVPVKVNVLIKPFPLIPILVL